MRKVITKTRKKSVFAVVMILCLCAFAAKAADQTVSIDGLATAEAVQNAINATGSSGTVTVTGTVTVAAQSTGAALTLSVPTEVTVKWQASIIGSKSPNAREITR